MIKYSSVNKSSIKLYESFSELMDVYGRQFPNFKRRIATIDPIYGNPNEYLYARNWSVSAEEYYGPNGNWDGFPEEELKTRYMTFIGSPVTMDHQPDIKIGMILDSSYIPWDKDRKIGGVVQNVLGIHKKTADKELNNFVDHFLNKEIEDTSMGAYVQYTICSICNNRATKESEYCPHIARAKGQLVVKASGESSLAYESCRDVTFFEDSIIVPLELGGRAGGIGADSNAEVLEVVASRSSYSEFPLKKYVIDRLSQIDYTLKKKADDESSNDSNDDAVADAAYQYIVKKIQEGEDLDTAVKEAEEMFVNKSTVTSSIKKVYSLKFKKFFPVKEIIDGYAYIELPKFVTHKGSNLLILSPDEWI